MKVNVYSIEINLPAAYPEPQLKSFSTQTRQFVICSCSVYTQLSEEEGGRREKSKKRLLAMLYVNTDGNKGLQPTIIIIRRFTNLQCFKNLCMLSCLFVQIIDRCSSTPSFFLEHCTC